VTLADAAASFKQCAQGLQRRAFVLVAPQLFELGCEMLIGRSTDLGDEREHRLGQRYTSADGQRNVRHQGRRTRRPVDQCHAFLRRQGHLRAQLEEQAPQRQDLARPAV
jgi:hypothetical protein